MTAVTGIAMYLVIWWIVLFAILPFGVRPTTEPGGRGQMAGAPEKPMMLKKVLWTSLAAAVVWGLIFAVVQSDLLPVRDALVLPPPPGR
jgi:predicted secreted protein